MGARRTLELAGELGELVREANRHPAEREDGEPKVASRWLQRLTAYCGDAALAAPRRRGQRFLGLARQLDRQETAPPGGGSSMTWES